MRISTNECFYFEEANGFDGQPASVGTGTDDVQSNNEGQSGIGTVVEPTTTKTISSTDGSASSTLQNVVSDELILPFLPPVTLHNSANGSNFLQAILDSNIPNDDTLMTPIEPFPLEVDLIRWEDAPSILDSTVPVLFDLPAPIEPLKETQTVKRVPSLLPICDMEKKTYGSAKKVSKTSQLILDVLDKYQQQKQQSVSTEEINVTIDYESDESIGRLTYDGDSE